jgi:hypothetical protein
MAVPTGRGETHANLAMLNPASRPAILARHPSRPLPFFEQPRFIEAQARLGSPICCTR